ncbi:PREDICTED: uncharacterized protein LOC108362858 [Rhagoletis zephyria]|uniref:uncharacterized protein LOC108362858 n=1 Tax=Rhagoletis zephyria TaxID=28612 RepID=UPI0008115EE7|nr:PREDICTED: uncharacterized protein LOC108362858 [Rhagoletis zephyria]
MAKLPPPPAGVNLVSYADDCTILATGPNIDSLCGKISDYLTDLANFFTAKSLTISAAKSTATLFTTWTNEVRLELDVYVNGNKIPTVNHPKILGVTFDSLFSFSAHASATCEKMRARNKVLKSLAGSTWGALKETLLTAYKAIGRSVANYAAPVWTAGTSDTQRRNL